MLVIIREMKTCKTIAGYTKTETVHVGEYVFITDANDIKHVGQITEIVE